MSDVDFYPISDRVFSDQKPILALGRIYSLLLSDQCVFASERKTSLKHFNVFKESISIKNSFKM